MKILLPAELLVLKCKERNNYTKKNPFSARQLKTRGKAWQENLVKNIAKDMQKLGLSETVATTYEYVVRDGKRFRIG